MPEIGEVARVVHYLRKHLVNRTITSVVTHEDDIVYGKVGCSATAFQKHVQGRKVTGAAQQGKYFYITLDKAPHPVLHLGMTGWMKFDREETHYYRQAKEKPEEPDAKAEEPEAEAEPESKDEASTSQAQRWRTRRIADSQNERHKRKVKAIRVNHNLELLHVGMQSISAPPCHAFC